MDELIRQVVERTGISEQQARTAVETVLGFLKTRLPAPIAGHLDSFTGGGASGEGSGGGLADQAGNVLGGLGGMFGGGNK